jgi:uncharacterized protein YkwD
VSSRDRERRRIGPGVALGTLAAAVLLVALTPTARTVALRPVTPVQAASLRSAIGDPAPPATPGRRTGQVSAAEQQTILDLHNRFRAAAGVTPLVWDDQLAADAQKWADALVARGGTLAHSNPADPNDPDTGNAKHEGENLAGGQSAATAPSQWYEEKAAFDAAPNKTGFNAANPDWFNWGHYTQMMWSATTKIGCGTAPGPIFVITSCRYSPPGNFDGQLAYPGADTLKVPGVAAAPDPAAPLPAAPVDGAPAPAGPPVDNGVPAPDPAPAQNPAPADAPAPADDATPPDAGPPAGDAPAPDDGEQAGAPPP